MAHVQGTHQSTRRLRILERPRGSAVLAARKQELLGFFFVDVVKCSSVFVVASAKAHQDFIAPRPDPVIGRPARKTTLFGIDDDVTDDAGPLAGLGDQR